MPPTPGSSRISASPDSAPTARANNGVTIAPARGAADITTAREMFAEYGDSIRAEACLTGFDEELATLPGAYAPPAGDILIARDAAGRPIGCIALRPLDGGAGEIKRLYVRPQGRRVGLGRALVLAIMERARGAGYGEVRLDSLASMVEAQALYRSLGFVDIERYNSNPNAHLVFMSKKL